METNILEPYKKDIVKISNLMSTYNRGSFVTKELLYRSGYFFNAYEVQDCIFINKEDFKQLSKIAEKEKVVLDDFFLKRYHTTGGKMRTASLAYLGEESPIHNIIWMHIFLRQLDSEYDIVRRESIDSKYVSNLEYVVSNKIREEGLGSYHSLHKDTFPERIILGYLQNLPEVKTPEDVAFCSTVCRNRLQKNYGIIKLVNEEG